MTISIDILRTSDSGDIGRIDFFAVMVRDADAEFSFDIDGPKNFLNLSYQEIFERIGDADPDAWETMALAVADGRPFVFNGVEMTTEEVLSALDGNGHVPTGTRNAPPASR